MSSSGGSAAARLRAAFDGAFADAPATAAATTRVLLLRAGAMPIAVSMTECSKIHAADATTPLPAERRAFVGLCAVDGAVLPLYDLASLVVAAASPGDRRWMLVSSGRHRVCFAIDGIDGYGDIPADRAYVDGDVITIDRTPRRIVSLTSLVRAIEAGGDIAQPKE